MFRRVIPQFVIAMLFLCASTVAHAAAPQEMILLLDKRAYSDLSAQFVGEFVNSVSRQKKPGPRFSMIVFGKYVSYGLPLGNISEDRLTSVMEEMLNDWSDGSSDSAASQGNPAIGIDRAIDEFRTHGKAGARKDIIVLSPGRIDTGNSQNDSEFSQWLSDVLVKDAAEEKIRIEWISHGAAPDSQFIEKITSAIGGSYYRLSNQASSDALITSLSTSLNVSPADTVSGQLKTRPRKDSESLTGSVAAEAAPQTARTMTSAAEKTPTQALDSATGSIEIREPAPVEKPLLPVGEPLIQPAEKQAASVPLSSPEEGSPQERNLFVYLLVLAGLALLGAVGYLFFRDKQSVRATFTPEVESEPSPELMSSEWQADDHAPDVVDAMPATTIAKTQDTVPRPVPDRASAGHPPTQPKIQNTSEFAQESAEKAVREPSARSKPTQPDSRDDDPDTVDTLPVATAGRTEDAAPGPIPDREQTDNPPTQPTIHDAPSEHPRETNEEARSDLDDTQELFSPLYDAQSEDRDDADPNSLESASVNDDEATEFAHEPGSEASNEPTQNSQEPVPEPSPSVEEDYDDDATELARIPGQWAKSIDPKKATEDNPENPSDDSETKK